MIIFACKKIKQEELFRCSFELNKTDYNILIYLLKTDKFFTVSALAESMKLERTTVQKAVKNLLRKKLIKRRKKNLDKGGYIYMYKINDKNEIKERMKKIVHEWYKKVKQALDNM